MPNQSLNIIVVDDHKIVTEGLAALLKTILPCNVVAQLHSGQEALKYVQAHSVDIVFMDIVMPGRMNGIAATRQIKESSPNTKVIALTMLSDRATIRAMTEAGADGFLIKNSSSEQILRAIQSVQDNQYYLHPTLHSSLNLSDTIQYPPNINLTEIEYGILKHILNGKTTSEISKEEFRSPETIKTHRKRIMAKLRCKNIAELVRLTIENKILK